MSDLHCPEEETEAEADVSRSKLLCLQCHSRRPCHHLRIPLSASFLWQLTRALSRTTSQLPPPRLESLPQFCQKPPPALPPETHQAQAQQKGTSCPQSNLLILPSPATSWGSQRRNLCRCGWPGTAPYHFSLDPFSTWGGTAGWNCVPGAPTSNFRVPT